MESETEPRYRFEGQLLAVRMMSATLYFPDSHDRALMRHGYGGGVGGVGAASLVLCEVVVDRSRA